jgi:hypothetical protein
MTTIIEQIAALEAEKQAVYADYDSGAFGAAARRKRLADLDEAIGALWKRRRAEKQRCTVGEVQPIRMPK